MMDKIAIKKISNTIFEVTVNAGSTTNHTVTLSEDYYQKLTHGKVDKETLIKKSFEFLLQHESNTSILKSFELPVISRYFPNYEGIITNMI